MPFYKEEAIIGKVVKDIQEVFDQRRMDYELVLVKNGCNIKTREIIDQLVNKDQRLKSVTIPENQGYGWGIINGLNNANGEIIGFVDGDGQVPPEDILRVLKGFETPHEVFCKGIRYQRGDGLKRKFASFGYNALFKVLFLSNARDINGKPKLFKKEFYNSLNIKSKDWFIDPEIMLKVLHKGYKAKEIVVHFDERKEGKSNISLKTVKEFAKNLVIWRIALWKKKK